MNIYVFPLVLLLNKRMVQSVPRPGKANEKKKNKKIKSDYIKKTHSRTRFLNPISKKMWPFERLCSQSAIGKFLT